MVLRIEKCITFAEKLIGKSANEAAKTGFSRLKSIFTADMNYEHYGKIIETAKNKIVGNIPDEMIVKAHPEKKGDMIKQAQRAFSLISEELSEISSLRLKELRNFDLSKADDETLINLFSGKGGLSGL